MKIDRIVRNHSVFWQNCEKSLWIFVPVHRSTQFYYRFTHTPHTHTTHTHTTQKIRFLNTRMPVATAIAALTRGLPKYSCWHARLKKFLDLGPNEYAFFLRWGLLVFCFCFFGGTNICFIAFYRVRFVFLHLFFLLFFWGVKGDYWYFACLFVCLCFVPLFCSVLCFCFFLCVCVGDPVRRVRCGGNPELHHVRPSAPGAL